MEDVWQFRYYETTEKGQRCRRSRIIGTLNHFPTRADALCILERFRLRLNLQHRFGRPVSLDALIDHYVERELPQLRYGTQQAHLSTLNRWIRPRWGARLLDEVRPMEVEQWLRSLPLAPKTKVNLKSLFHLMYQHGRRWELGSRGAYRALPNDGSGGGLSRSQADLSVPDDLVDLLDQWRSITPYNQPHDWVFASPFNKGSRPLWSCQVLKDYVQPVAVKAGLPKIGWHSFRHTVSAWGKEAGFTLEEVKTLLRHENIATTSQVYGAPQMEAKRELQRRLVEFVKRSAEQEGWKPKKDSWIEYPTMMTSVQ